MAINFAAASTAGLNNPGTEIITLVKDDGGNFINPPSYDKMLAYLRSGDVPCLFVTDVAGTTGDIYQFSGYSDTENKIRFTGEKTAIEFSEGSDVPVETDIGGGGAEITDGIVVKARDVGGNATEVDYYNSTGTIPKLEFGNSRANGVGTWSASFITKINLKDNAYTVGAQAFYGCANLTTIDFSKFTEFPNAVSGNSGWEAQFYGCSGLTVIDAPNLTGGLGCYAFYNCTGLTTINMPKINALHGYGSAGRGCFGGCTAMVEASFGSIGHPVETINIAAFGGCTQSGLTITVYTTGAYADTAVANIRNGATNATIIIKTSEDTTYNDVSYAAGDTMITSEVS